MRKSVLLEQKAPESDPRASSFRYISPGSRLKFPLTSEPSFLSSPWQGFLPGPVRRAAELCAKGRPHRQGKSDVSGRPDGGISRSHFLVHIT